MVLLMAQPTAPRRGACMDAGDEEVEGEARAQAETEGEAAGEAAGEEEGGEQAEEEGEEEGEMILLYKTGKVKHAFAAWHDGKVRGCTNYEYEEGEKWKDGEFPILLPNLEDLRLFHDGAGCQYQCRETIHGTARSFADTGVRISHHVSMSGTTPGLTAHVHVYVHAHAHILASTSHQPWALGDAVSR
jgi:hypothetical protein